MALIEASYSSTVILPSRSRISPRRSLGRLRRREHDAAVLEIERLARPARNEGEDSRGPGQAEVLEDFGNRQLGDLALQSARNHERLEALRKSRCHQELV
jgi:hypothetical protein